MSTFDLAFNKAVAKGGGISAAPATLAGARQSGHARHALLEETFRTVERFEIDPTRLVVSGSLVGEQYRALRANVLRFKETEGLGSFVFSSSMKGEGKTTVVVNTARTFAKERDAKVAIVDFDLKRPTVAEICGAEVTTGIEEVLAGTATLASCGIYSRADNFAIFSAKHHQVEGSDALSSASVERLVAELESIFDFIFFDTGPILSTTEPLVLGGRTGGVILVVRANSTQKESVLYAQGLLEQAGCRLLGMVLNARPSYVPRWWLLRRYDYFQDEYTYKAKS